MFLVLFNGMNGTLHFLSSWGYTDYEDGSFLAYKEIFAFIFAFFAGATIMDIILTGAKTAFENEINEIKAKELDRILFASQQKLEDLQKEYKYQKDQARSLVNTPIYGGGDERNWYQQKYHVMEAYSELGQTVSMKLGKK